MRTFTNEARKTAILRYYNKKYSTRISLKTTDNILTQWLEAVEVKQNECIPAEIMNVLKNVNVPADIVKSWKGIEYLYEHKEITPTPTEAPTEDTPTEDTTEAEAEKAPTPTEDTPTVDSDKLKALEMLSQLFTSPAVDMEALKQLVVDEVQKVTMPIQVEYKPVEGEKKAPKKLDKISHNKTASIVKILQAGLNVYLYGEAGTGKSQIAEDVANILDIPFYFTGKCNTEYDLIGFKNAVGEYVPTAFYKAFTEGGLFLFDEIDASNENALIKFNSALSQGYFDFPVGNVKKHPDFICIATGNTAGKGATMRYNTRRKLDGSTLDRFAMLHIDYDEAIENVVAGGNIELVEYIHHLRASAVKNDIELIVSYRAINKVVKLEAIKEFTLAEVLKMAIFGSMSIDDIVILISDIKISNKYVTAMSELL